MQLSKFSLQAHEMIKDVVQYLEFLNLCYSSFYVYIYWAMLWLSVV